MLHNIVKCAVSLGGPEQFTYPEIASLCFEMLGKPVQVKQIPLFIFDGLLVVLKAINPALWSVMRFLRWASTTDLTAPQVGSRTVRDYLAERLQNNGPAASR